jgi:hypothetical protein
MEGGYSSRIVGLEMGRGKKAMNIYIPALLGEHRACFLLLLCFCLPLLLPLFLLGLISDNNAVEQTPHHAIPPLPPLLKKTKTTHPRCKGARSPPTLPVVAPTYLTDPQRETEVITPLTG